LTFAGFLAPDFHPLFIVLLAHDVVIPEESRTKINNHNMIQYAIT
jgi:hypothetical protein